MYARLMYRHTPSIAQSCCLRKFSNVIDKHEAMRILSLTQSFSPKDLRDSYFHKAKLCHPDSAQTNISQDELTSRFLQITEAYEFLQKYKKESIGMEDDIDLNFISKTEEQHYREACRESLGLDAETVEESKRCPLFREWLKGRSDAAFHWNAFFMKHGGLAPMLKTRHCVLSMGANDGRRRRKRK